VKVGVGTLPDMELAGEVVFIASKGDATMHYEVEIILKDKHQNIRPGMYGYAGFSYGRDEALLIDRKALAEGLKNPEVFVVEDGIAIRNKIKVFTVSARIFPKTRRNISFKKVKELNL
jgi:membrane fusion protein, multidrug efflux system